MKRKKIFSCLLAILPFLAGSQQPIPFRQGNLWGFADENRHLVIPAVYDQVRSFQDLVYDCSPSNVPYAIATRGDSTWLIGTDGTPFFPGILKEAYPDLRCFGDHLFRMNTPAGAFILDRSLHVQRFLPDRAIHTYPFMGLEWKEADAAMEEAMLQNGRWDPNCLCGDNFTRSPAYWNVVDFGQYFAVTNRQKTQYGLIDELGREVIPMRYRVLGNFWQGKAVANQTIIDLQGKELFRSTYLLAPRISAEGLIQAKDSVSQRIGFINTAGETVITPRYLRAYGFYRGLAFCQQSDSNWVIINQKDQILLEIFPDKRLDTKFSRVSNCPTGVRVDQGLVWSEQVLFARLADGYWHCFDWQLHELTTAALASPPLRINWRGWKGYLGEKDGLILFFDPHWTVLSGGQYDYLEDARTWRRKMYGDTTLIANLLIGVKGERKVLLSRRLEPIGEVVEKEFDYTGTWNMVVKKDGKYGAVDSLGQYLIEPLYDYLEYYGRHQSAGSQTGMLIAAKNGRYGLLNVDGSVVVPLVFREVHDLWREDSVSNPLGTWCNVDSLRGKWHFINSIGLYREFPDSVLSITYESMAHGPIAQTARQKYRINQYTGQLQSLTSERWPPHLLSLKQSLDRLSDSLEILGTFDASDWQAYVSGTEQLLIYQPKKAGSPTASAVIFDRYGHRLLEKITQVQSADGALGYVQEGYYRQWKVPLTGRYTFGTYDYTPNRQNGNFIGSLPCGQGVFRADGTCLLPVRCGQRIEYDYWLKGYLVSNNGQMDLFDPISSVFRTAAARYLPYHNFNMSPGYTPPGYFEVEIDGKSGLVRIEDGAAFFEDK